MHLFVQLPALRVASAATFFYLSPSLSALIPAAVGHLLLFLAIYLFALFFIHAGVAETAASGVAYKVSNKAFFTIHSVYISPLPCKYWST
jgi:hypothetical protein